MEKLAVITVNPILRSDTNAIRKASGSKKGMILSNNSMKST